jgi:hypothetical protein
MLPGLRAKVAASDSAAAQRRLEGAWTYESSEDPMTGRSSHRAWIRSTNTLGFDFPYEGAQRGRLVVRTHPQYGKDVILQIDKGQFLCSSYMDCRVLVRFDDAPAERYAGAEPADNSTTSVFIRNHDRFLQRLRSARRVRIQVNVYQEGAPVFEFDVGGFNAARYAGRE